MRVLLIILWLTPLLVVAQNDWKDVYSEKAWEARDSWQRPDEIIEMLELSSDGVVADIGSHEGYFTMKLARRVSQGIVYAVDLSATRLERLEKIAKERHINNVRATQGKPDDPGLTANSLNAVLIVDTYHEIKNYKIFLQNVKTALKKGGRLVICEPIALERIGSSREDQYRKHELELKFVLADLQEGGFEIVRQEEDFVDRLKEKGDRMWIVIAQKKP
jgi:predicted methyltransferase